jgi:hypothetical protein
VAIDVVLTPDKEADKEDQLETKLAQPERKESIADDGGLYQARTVTQREKLRGWITEWCRRYDDQRGICGKIAVQIAFELQLFLWSVWFGPYFTTAAAFTLALDAWRDDGSARELTPELKNNQLNGIVLGVAEACGESLPQLFAQSYFFVQDLNELSPIDHGIFASSATCCVGGILYAMYNMWHSYSDIQEHMRPPVMSARQMHALRISAKEARAVGHDVAELKDAGFSLDELEDAGFYKATEASVATAEAPEATADPREAQASATSPAADMEGKGAKGEGTKRPSAEAAAMAVAQAAQQKAVEDGDGGWSFSVW